MVRKITPLTEREEMLVAYGYVVAARGIQVDGIGRLQLALDRLPREERGNLMTLAEASDEALKRLRMALARKLSL